MNIIKTILAGEDTDNKLILDPNMEHVIISTQSLHYLLPDEEMKSLINNKEDGPQLDLYIVAGVIEEIHQLVHMCYDACDRNMKASFIINDQEILFNT